MKNKLIEIGLYSLGGFIILFSLTIDLLRGRSFGIGFIQLFLSVTGLLIILSGWLVKKKHSKALFFLFFSYLLFVFAYLKLQIFNLDHFRIWKDVESYVLTSLVPLNQLDFWNGLRPFILPLIYKILGVTSENYYEESAMTVLLVIQLIAGLVSWSLLAYAASRLFKNDWFKAIAVLVVFSLGLGLHASMWDKLMLTESFSNSLFILLISLLLLLFTKGISKRVTTLIDTILLVFITFLYLFIRDANGYFILFGSLLVFVYWLFIGRKSTQKRLLLGISVMGILLSISSLFIMNLSSRWWAPIQHVLYDRRETVPELAQYFKANDFDLIENTPYLMDPLVFKDIDNPLDLSLKTEKLKTAKSIYARFMLTHPGYTFISPFSDFNNIYNPDNLPYRYNLIGTPTWVYQLTNFGYPKGLWVVAVGFICSILYLIISNERLKSGALVILILILSDIPLGMLYWLSDTVEIQRHSQQLFLQSRIGFWLSILLLIECVIRMITARRLKERARKNPVE